MTADFVPSAPEKEQVTLTFPDTGVSINTWTDYTYAAHIEIPTDGWSFTLASNTVTDDLDLQAFFLVGRRVRLALNGGTQGDGYIDSVEVSASRRGGALVHVQGRDKIAAVVDAHADPTYTFKEGMTLEDVLLDLFSPFGWSAPDQFILDNEVNTLAKAGIRGTPHSRGKRNAGKPLKKYLLHQLRPYPREGVFAFASRICKRHGLMIWQTASGEQIVVSRPNFDIDPFYKLRRNLDGTTNVLAGSVKYDIKNQPTAIVADGSSGGGEFGRGRIKSIMANTVVSTVDPEYLTPFKRYPDANRVLGHAFPTPVSVPRAKTLYLHDEESTTQEQLDNFLRREMAHLQRESIVATYEVEGHGQITDDGFVPWTIDTTVDVEDDIAHLRERMYVAGRTFHKSRHGGTTTTLQLIRLHTIELGEPIAPKPAPVVQTDAEIVQTRRAIESIEL
jgi:prophage tail gpP-like protein